MRKQRLLFFWVFLSLIYSNFSTAATFYAIADGPWHDDATWSGTGIPGPTDDVVIDGFNVTFNEASGDRIVGKIEMYNTSFNIAGTSLTLTGSKILTVNTQLFVKATNPSPLTVDISGTSGLSVLGDVTFDRSTPAASGDGLFQLKIGGKSIFKAHGNFAFEYNAAAPDEGFPDVLVVEAGTLVVEGIATLKTTGGKELSLELRDSSIVNFDLDLVLEMSGGDELEVRSVSDKSELNVLGNLHMTNSKQGGEVEFGDGAPTGTMLVKGDVTMTSTVANAIVELGVRGSKSSLTVEGDINMNATSSGAVFIELEGTTTLHLGGDINRLNNNRGYMTMSSGSTLDLNGKSGTQKVPGSGTFTLSESDSLQITNLTFNNTSGTPLVLEGPLVVNDFLDMKTGIIEASETNKIFIKDGAGIGAGNEHAYINGPVVKEGSSNGLPFIFPVGNGTTYAPIEVSALSSGSSFTATFKGDPPPWGYTLGEDVVGVNGDQFWTLERTAGSDIVDITLHWMDGDALQIEDLDNLAVLGLSAANVFESYGNGGTTGGTGFVSGAGSVISADGDPPPFGIGWFGVGTVEAPSLPVELTQFSAHQESAEVLLDWETATEMNTSHFIVERSLNGINFEELTSVWSDGEGSVMRLYSAKDVQPYYGENFYRLKMVDKDGSFEYSHVEVVKFQASGTVDMYPNPVDEVIQLQGPETINSNGVIEVYDGTGLRIYSGDADFENGRFYTTAAAIKVETPGTYILRVTIGTENHVIKFVKLP